MKSYIPKAQKLIIDISKVKLIILIFIPVKSSTPGTLESTIDTPGIILVKSIFLKLSILELSQLIL